MRSTMQLISERIHWTIARANTISSDDIVNPASLTKSELRVNANDDIVKSSNPAISFFRVAGSWLNERTLASVAVEEEEGVVVIWPCLGIRGVDSLTMVMLVGTLLEAAAAAAVEEVVDKMLVLLFAIGKRQPVILWSKCGGANQERKWVGMERKCSSPFGTCIRLQTYTHTQLILQHVAIDVCVYNYSGMFPIDPTYSALCVFSIHYNDVNSYGRHVAARAIKRVVVIISRNYQLRIDILYDHAQRCIASR